jgi:hypothetical protein
VIFILSFFFLCDEIIGSSSIAFVSFIYVIKGPHHLSVHNLKKKCSLQPFVVSIIIFINVLIFQFNFSTLGCPFLCPWVRCVPFFLLEKINGVSCGCTWRFPHHDLIYKELLSKNLMQINIRKWQNDHF